jgi:hypothetical protein
MSAAYFKLAKNYQSSPVRVAAFRALKEQNRVFGERVTAKKNHVFDTMVRDIGKVQNTTSLMRMIKTKKAREERKHCRLDPEFIDTHADHYRSTFGMPPAGEPPRDLPPLNYTPRVFTPDEIYKQLARTSMGKAAGVDGFPGEFFVYGAEVIAPVLTILINTISAACEIPLEWSQALVVPVYKNKGSDKEAKNYRPISLTVIVRRLYERLIAEELAPGIELLSDTQGGFRRHRSTLDQCFALSEIFNHHPDAHHAFLDIRAAFDSVNRGRLWSSLYYDYHIPLNSIKRLQSLFDHNSSTLIINNHHSQPIPNLRGMFQGSSLSPILFNFYIDPLLKRLRQDNSPTLRTAGIKTNHLGFADDLELHGGTTVDLQILLDISQAWSLRNGMEFQPSKCFYLSATSSPHSRFTIYGQNIPQASTVDYLGIPFNINGIDFLLNATRRSQKSKQVANCLNMAGMNIAGFPPDASARLYKSFIRPVFEYGAQLTLSTTKILQKAQNYALRKIFSAHTSTSTNALQKLLHVEPFLLRNQIISSQFYARLHNSTDAAIPAVRFYRAAVEAQRPSSLVTALHSSNPTWLKAHRIPFLTNPLRRAACTPAHAFSTAQKRKMIHLEICSLDARNTNVAGAITVLPADPPVRHIFRAASMPPKHIRIPIYRWLLGHIAVHMPCKCGQELSRAHAVECSNITPVLKRRFPYVTAPVGQNLLDAVLNHHRHSCPPHGPETDEEDCFQDFYRSIAIVISRIYHQCLGYRQKDNGFFSAPDSPRKRPRTTSSQRPGTTSSHPVPSGHPEPVPVNTSQQLDPVVDTTFYRPPRNPR